MDKKKLLMPIGGLFGALLLVLLLTFPMLSMEPKNIPVGVYSLDEGAKTPAGDVNAGDKFIRNIVKADNELIDFKKAKSEKSLKKDLNNGKYYAIIIVPSDFTKQSMSGDSKIDVLINEGINPMVTMSLSQVLTMMGEKSEINFNITSINSVSKLGIKAMLLPMMLIMMTFVTSLLTSLLITLNIKIDNKITNYLKQLVYMIFMAIVVGFVVSSLAIGIASVDVDIVKVALYLTIVSFTLMVLVNGSINLFGKKGVVIPVLLFILGMGIVQIPYEYLNGVWQVLIASWEPFRYIGIGIREVLYQGKEVFNSSTISLVIVSTLGMVFSLISILKKEKNA